MEGLFEMYSHEIVNGHDENEMFANFIRAKRNRLLIEKWVASIMSKEQLKNNDTANKLRTNGNLKYKNHDFTESIRIYTEALCNSDPESESYSLILSNRSAVFFMMKRYLECLSDINNCLKSTCSENTTLKVYIRKIKCHYNTNSPDELEKAMSDALDYLHKCEQITDKSTLKNEILLYQNKVCYNPVGIDKSDDEKLPSLKDGMNPNFLYASNAISISYNKNRGRHVISNKTIHAGDVLFIEKPYIFAPVFTNTNKDLQYNRCYNCLRTTYASLPCNYCIKCIFCNEKCREASWNEFHKWECRGMRSDLWYHIGIAFPAFKALVRGIPTFWETSTENHETDTIRFGCEENNYLYFSRLLTNIEKMKNLLPHILCAAVVVTYLNKYTEFVSWFKSRPECHIQKYNNLVMYLGALLTRHMAQLQCNSSVIIHNDLDKEDRSVACAIYPSISMMNHSCKPNITLTYVRDIVIVCAAETIETNEEILNCYGIDHRYLDRDSRQEQCLNIYYFKCECRVCKN